MLNPSGWVLAGLQISKSNTVWKMLNLQEGRFHRPRGGRRIFKIPAKCYAGKVFYVEQQVLNADEIVLFYENVGKWTYRMWVASKPLALNHSKTANLIICEKYILNKLFLNRNTYKTRFSVDWLMKTLWSEAQRNLTLYSPRNNGSPFTNFVSV